MLFMWYADGNEFFVVCPFVMTSNTIIFWVVYTAAGLFLVFAFLVVIFYLQEPFCAIGVDTVNECLDKALERLWEQAKRAL